MSEYRFHLQKYSPGSKTVCPGCGRKACFTRYVDEEGQVSFPGNVGKCDHINSCGYHYTPREYFHDNPAVKDTLTGQDGYGNVTSTVIKSVVKSSPKSQPQIPYLPYAWVELSMQRFDINPLYRYLTIVAGKEKTERLFNLYKVGTSKMWHGATVFWQIDVNGNVRAGKIMGYDATTGHRIKQPFSQVSWVHSVRKIPGFHMRQCLFGEHLLADTSSLARTVGIVESEKTALIAALFIPDLVWRCKAKMLQSICKSATCSDLLEKMATDEQRSRGLDIADFLLMEDTPQMILQKMIELNPALQTFIDTFELELVDAGKME